MAPRAGAGPAAWTRTGPLLGGDVAVLAVDPTHPSRLYLGTRSNVEQSGVFRSVDGGETWTRVGPVELRSVERLAVHPRRGSTVYAMSYGAIYRSRDAGATWDRLELPIGPLPRGFVNLAIDPSRPARLVAVASFFCSPHCDEHYSLVFQSRDGGDTWKLVRRLPIYIVDLAIDPANPAVLYAGGDGYILGVRGVLKSGDGGRTWRAVGAGLRGAYVLEVAVDPTRTGTVYAGTSDSLFKSDDGGRSWRRIDRGLRGAGVTSLIVRPTQSAVLYAGTTDGLFVSANGGATWRVSRRGLSGGRIEALAVDPRTPAVLYAGSASDGLFKSVDGGALWKPKRRGLGLPAVASLAVAPGSPDVIFAGTDTHHADGESGGVYRSVNGGRTWRPVNRGLPAPRWQVRIVAVDPSDPGTVYAAPLYQGMYKSVDGGTSWSARNNGLGRPSSSLGPTVLDLAIDPRGTLYATSTSGVYKSTDGADSWSLASAGLLSSFHTYAVAVDPGRPARVYVSVRDLVYRSDDGAATWTAGGTAGGQYVLDLAVDPRSGDVYAATQAGAFKSTDHGLTWTAVGLPESVLVSKIEIADVLYAAVAHAGVFRSADGGETWTALDAGLPSASINTIAVAADGPVKVFAGFWGVAGVYEWEE